MTHDDTFLQAIRSSPDDDTPRLVYADWLEEHGQSDRAAFIRVQCRLALLPEGDPRRPELEARERGLLQEHGEEWTAPLRGLVDAWTFRRGFVEEITFYREPPPAVLAAVLAAVCAVAPIRNVAVMMGGGGA
jgi:uncharacterized protein (TIGR02996 family)